MPNGDRWRLYVQKESNKPGCWICDKYVYTLFFWTRSIGMKHAIHIHDRDKKDEIDHKKVFI